MASGYAARLRRSKQCAVWKSLQIPRQQDVTGLFNVITQQWRKFFNNSRSCREERSASWWFQRRFCPQNELGWTDSKAAFSWLGKYKKRTAYGKIFYLLLYIFWAILVSMGDIYGFVCCDILVFTLWKSNISNNGMFNSEELTIKAVSSITFLYSIHIVINGKRWLIKACIK